MYHALSTPIVEVLLGLRMKVNDGSLSGSVKRKNLKLIRTCSLPAAK